MLAKSENLIPWLTVIAIKCSIIKENSFLVIISNLMLLSHVQIIPFWKKLLHLIWRITSVILWGVLILIILSSFGRYLAFGSTLDSYSTNNMFKL
jgi:hypothetical protein